MSWVTVFQAFNPAEAQLIRSRLEAAGLLVNVAHELAALSLDGYSQAAGGILVQVPQDVAEEARALIASKDGDTE
ncbi:MAG: putative signal transducing protein [Limisphaerales bacterium]